jgi:hypothetical protein
MAIAAVKKKTKYFAHIRRHVQEHNSMDHLERNKVCHVNYAILLIRAGHVERYQLQSYRFKPFFVTL